MKLVFLSSEMPHQIHLINETHKHHPVSKVFFQPLPGGTRSSFSQKLRKLISPKKLRIVVRTILRSKIFGGEDAKGGPYESEQFFGGAAPALSPDIPVEHVASFNRSEGVEAVRNENPDLIVVFGTDILRGDILNVANLDILNIHRDIVPKYRGGGMPFWVLYNKDFENLGVTIHVCASKLDAGDIVGQEYYRLAPDDAMYTLRYKTTLLAEKLLRDVIDDYLNGTVTYRKQEPSKLWTSRDLTLWKEYRARKNLDRHVQSLSE